MKNSFQHLQFIASCVIFIQFSNVEGVLVNQYDIFLALVNPHDFIYVINPALQICGKQGYWPSVFLLIYVHTSPENLKRRLAIWETWTRRRLFGDIRIVFMMGKAGGELTERLVNLEANTYNDIVQENFVDSYKNLTFKGIMALKWISTYCNETKYILKVTIF